MRRWQRHHTVSAHMLQIAGPSLTNELVGTLAYVNFPLAPDDPSRMSRDKLDYPYKGIYNNGDPQATVRLFRLGLGNYLGGFLPWTLFLIPAIWWWRVAPDRGRRRLLAWGAVFVAAIAISGSQRSRYFLPVLPVLALLVAEFLVRAPVAVTASPGAQVGARGRRALAVVVAVLAVGAVVGAAILLLLPELTGLGHNLIYVPAPGLERWLVAVLALTGSNVLLSLTATRSDPLSTANPLSPWPRSSRRS